MNRRTALKTLTAFNMAGLLPEFVRPTKPASGKIHLVGIGGGGCKALEYIHKKGVAAEYTFTGSNLTRALAGHLSTGNKKFMIICSMPFSFEGERRKRIALNTLCGLCVTLCGLVVKFFRLIYPGLDLHSNQTGNARAMFFISPLRGFVDN